MKKIGLLTDIADGKINLNFAYFRFAEKFGSVKLLHPHDENIQELDLLILPGGQDVLPFRYGETKIPWLSGGQNDNYEYFDCEILPKYIKNKTPIFGICRGLQTLNVLFGGSLNQHIEEPYSAQSRGELVHAVMDTRSLDTFGVNSLHHQSIKVLGEGFSPILKGVRKRKGHIIDMEIEAIKHLELPILATQFHPEELNNEESREAREWTMKEIWSIMPI